MQFTVTVTFYYCKLEQLTSSLCRNKYKYIYISQASLLPMPFLLSHHNAYATRSSHASPRPHPVPNLPAHPVPHLSPLLSLHFTNPAPPLPLFSLPHFSLTPSCPWLPPSRPTQPTRSLSRIPNPTSAPPVSHLRMQECTCYIWGSFYFRVPSRSARQCWWWGEGGGSSRLGVR